MIRFTIRGVLWLTALAAVLTAWLLDHAKNRIDWQQVKAERQELRRSKELQYWAEMRAKTAREQKTNLLRAAARRGITPLDIEPETKVRPELLNQAQ